MPKPNLFGRFVGIDLVLDELASQRNQIMALADTLAQLQAEDTELAADVQALAAAISSSAGQIAALQQQIADLIAQGTVTPEDLAALQTVADDLANTHAAAVAAIPTT
jgi:uncharacterized protein (DUF3084 family)